MASLRTSAPAEAAAAVVAGRPLAAAAVRARVAALRTGPLRRALPPEGTADARRFERFVAQALIARVVLEHEARRRGIRASGEAAARELFRRITAGVEVPEARIRACYEAGAGRWRRPERRRVRHVLLRDEPAARSVIERAAAGARLDRLARELSCDAASRARGGDLGELRRGELAGAFEDAVFSAAPGRVVGPLRTEFGWHVAQVEAVLPAEQIGYEQARAVLRDELLAVARQRAFEDWLARRTAVLAQVAPDWRHPGDPRSADRRHRH